MAGFQIPMKTKIDLLENIVIPFFDVTLDSQTRKDWMTETAGNVYGDKLETLIRSTNFIKSLKEAKAELREKEERAEAKLREERAFILQQQHAGTFICILFLEQSSNVISLKNIWSSAIGKR
jgi:hypothetical protein